MFFFFKQKTAYEMRISDWSSDVCSSDLIIPPLSGRPSYRAGASGAPPRHAGPASHPSAEARTGVANRRYLFTTESVSEGHPDKVSDRISDAIVDAFLTADTYSRVAVETLCPTNLVVLTGEVRGPAKNGRAHVLTP